jgi:hypothetical protein
VQPARKRSNAAVFAALAALAALGGAAYAGYQATRAPTTHRHTTHTPRRDAGASEVSTSTDGFVSLASNRELLATLTQWHQTLSSPRTRNNIEPFYADAVQFHGSNGLASPSAIRSHWRSVFGNGGLLEFDWARSRVRERNPELSDGAPAACINAAGASGKIFDVRAQAREVRNDRHPDIGCAELRGVYLLRLRRIGTELKICHETWSLREGICPSCPTARVCQGR